MCLLFSHHLIEHYNSVASYNKELWQERSCYASLEKKETERIKNIIVRPIVEQNVNDAKVMS
jgi:hypothetical protein